ncbi:MAG: hypothetical protein JNJ61_05610 [Anaerolineae bacterium]|nr:hypothetical protein [Anaerolineae bacterium]
MGGMLDLLRFVFSGRSAHDIIIRVIGLVVIAIIVVLWTGQNRSPSSFAPDNAALLPTRGALTDAGTLPMGATVSGTLLEGQRQAWLFEGERGQRVNLRVRGEVDSTLELIPPGQSDSIAIDFNSGGGYDAFICNQPLYESGSYRAVVSSYLGTPDRAVGAYELSLEAETAVETRPIAYGETVEGQLTTCDGDYYALAVEAGDTLRVTLTADDGANLYIRLLTRRAAAEVLAFSRQEDGQDVLEFTVEANGDVIIQVNRPPNEPEASYRLSVGRG